MKDKLREQLLEEAQKKSVLFCQNTENGNLKLLGILNLQKVSKIHDLPTDKLKNYMQELEQLIN